MRRKSLLLILWWTISSLWAASPIWAQAGCTITVTGAGSYSTGSNIILSATASGTCQPISSVSYYNGTTLLGSSNSSPYTFTWNTTGLPAGTYNNVFATAYFSGSAGGSGTTVIDMVGSPSLGANPAANSKFGEGGAGAWVPGDDQMCEIATWPYNGSTSSVPDGTCELTGTANAPTGTPTIPPATWDSLDDTMHTLSDFSVFANNFLGQSIGSLSSTFSAWYPGVTEWIDPTTGRLPPLVGNLNAWTPVITSWLNVNYTNANAWCVPAEATLLSGNAATAEDTYINNSSNSLICNDGSTCTGGKCTNGSVCSTTWGDLPHVIACMDYNSNPAGGTALNSSVFNYQQCQIALTTGTCPGALPAQCAASALGRSLLGTAAPAYDGCAGNFATWVSNSLTLATDEAPKFAMRGAYLTDIYSRALTMSVIFPPAATAIQNFLSGPAAQLSAVACAPDGSSCPTPKVPLPNSVIYAWVDNTYPNGHPGYAHIVKVTAYAAGRNGDSSNGTANSLAQAVLPWIKTTVHIFTRDYTLRNRDGSVYVSVKRWDQDHANTILFPNGHQVWQFLFHNPVGASTTTGQGLPASCVGPGGFGFGLEPLTVSGLQMAGISSTDTTALANAVMLNDEGNGTNAGKIDPSVKTDGAQYLSCLSQLNKLLDTAPESHVCVKYVASSNASHDPSPDPDPDYSLKFVDCGTVDGGSLPPDDLTYE